MFVLTITLFARHLIVQCLR